MYESSLPKGALSLNDLELRRLLRTIGWQSSYLSDDISNGQWAQRLWVTHVVAFSCKHFCIIEGEKYQLGDWVKEYMMRHSTGTVSTHWLRVIYHNDVIFGCWEKKKVQVNFRGDYSIWHQNCQLGQEYFSLAELYNLTWHTSWNIFMSFGFI